MLCSKNAPMHATLHLNFKVLCIGHTAQVVLASAQDLAYSMQVCMAQDELLCYAQTGIAHWAGHGNLQSSPGIRMTDACTHA
jgi:hypothetical protein